MRIYVFVKPMLVLVEHDMGPCDALDFVNQWQGFCDLIFRNNLDELIP
ncbi:hypothetical protein SLEP1_g18488 [Rubroshorea leprosula]|uniref:Uncharacterized protein n=1 Tax=Rubroshorea leprosula TaxID=152421 RepID=A0AAV5J6J9_9ROSI|nr:hypothetical protein SLEP1_g18488 [Rubroshorea leprosula]